MKEGDKLYCIKKESTIRRIRFWKFYDKFPEFTDGKVYKIFSVLLGSVDGSGKPFNSLVFLDDTGDMRFLNNLGLNNLSEILYTEKQWRKIKLDKINERR